MLILGCTQKLRKKNLGPLVGTDSLVPTLGGWHANLIYLARSPVVLCVNDSSLLAVLARGRQFTSILSVLKSRIAGRYKRMGLSGELLIMEQAAMEVVAVQPSNSKSVLGSMNDFAHALKWHVRDQTDLSDLDKLEDMLSQTPMGALKYEYPVEVASRLFGMPFSLTLVHA